MRPTSGMALVAFGAIGFGLMPLFARMAYAEDMPALSLLIWRFAIASLCLLPFAGRLLAAKRDTLIAIAAGASYMGANLFYFLALKQLTVALTVLILFTYPLFTILMGWVIFRERVTWPAAIAALLVLLAALLILSPAGFGTEMNWTGIGMAFIPPVAYAAFVHIAAKRLGNMALPVRLGGVFLGGLLAMLVLGLLFDGRIAMPSTSAGWLATAALALVSTVLALGLLLIGASIAGAERAAIAGSTELVTALLVGALAYGETLDTYTLLGAAMIVIAIALAARGSKPHAE